MCFNKDKDTEWLNEMARNGYAMTGFFAGFYIFDRCEPGEYVYQIDISEGPFRVSNDYREFMREAGVEIVCLGGMWVLLRRKAAEGDFVLYTDVESNITHYTKIRKMFKVFALIECLCLIMELLAAAYGGSASWAALACSFLIAAFIIGMIREVWRVDEILDELKQRIGQRPEGAGRKNLSLFIPVSCLLNGIGYAVPVWRYSHQFLLSCLKGFCHGLAIMLLVVGIVHTFWKRGD